MNSECCFKINFSVFVPKLKKIIGSSKARVATAEVSLHLFLKGIFPCMRVKDNLHHVVQTAEDGEAVSTSLQAYFFGKKGENKLKYQEFHR